MKNILKKIGFLALTIAIVSCDLDREPYDGIEDEKLLSTVEGFNTALKGAYGGMRSYGYYSSDGGIFMCPDILSDNLTYNFQGRGSFRTLFELRYKADETGYQIYSQAYRVISRANKILDNIDNLQANNTALKNKIKGEALALRAIAHFDIARVNCKIPTQSTDAKQSMGIYYSKSFAPEGTPRRYGTTVDEVYVNVIKDLQDALTLIGDTKTDGHLNKTAINAILSRVYLYYGDYQKAVEYANSAITDGSVRIAKRNEFASVWTDEFKSNVLFRILFIDKDNIQIGNAYGQMTNGKNRAEYVCSYSFYRLFKDTDIRKSTSIYTGNYGGKEYHSVSKYMGRATGNRNVVDGKYIRLEEVYLTRAEAYYKLGNQTQALADLNAIRTERYENYTPGTETGDDLFNAIILERRLELAFEGDRFFTLKRLGLPIQRDDKGEYTDGGGTPISTDFRTLPVGDYRWQLPIPKEAFSANPSLTSQDQNPGYY